MRNLLIIIWAVSMLLCGLSFLGALHAAFDSLAILRMVFWLAALLSLWALRKKRSRLLSLFALLIMAIPFLKLLPPPIYSTDAILRVYQHNLYVRNPADDLRQISEQLKPEVMLLQEVNAARSIVGNLKAYPHQQLCPFNAIGDTAVISRLPIRKSGCSQSKLRGFAWAVIDTPIGPITFISLHLHWPFPHHQSKQIDAMIPEIEKLPRPIFIGGDFNQMAWSYTIKRFEKASGSKLASGLHFTLIRPPLLFLPIDHVIAPKGSQLSIRKLDRYGSDHNALLISFHNLSRQEISGD